MKQEYETVKELAKDYRAEITPMLKSKGFTLSISTSKGSYWNDGRMNFQIKKVPSNFMCGLMNTIGILKQKSPRNF